MAQIIGVFVFFAIAALAMMLALQFSKYKQRASGCCGGVHCATDKTDGQKVYGCYKEKMDFVRDYPSNS